MKVDMNEGYFDVIRLTLLYTFVGMAYTWRVGEGGERESTALIPVRHVGSASVQRTAQLPHGERRV